VVTKAPELALYAHAAMAGAVYQLHGKMPRCIVQRFDNSRHGLLVYLVNRAAKAEAGFDSKPFR